MTSFPNYLPNRWWLFSLLVGLLPGGLNAIEVGDLKIEEDTVWSEDMVIRGTVQVAAGATRPLTLSELETIEVTTPVLKVMLGEVRYRLTVQVSYDGESWKTVYDGGADAAEVPILLEDYPEAARVGLTGYFTGPLSVDGLGLLKPEGEELRPTRAQARNAAAEVEKALEVDGQCASVSHNADPLELRQRFDGVEVTFEYEGGKPPVQPLPRPGVDLPPARYGLYLCNYGIGDPHAVPPGYVLPFDVEACARYDFSIMQTPNADQFAQILARNPDHRLILRGVQAQGDFLGYGYDEKIRADKRKAVLDEIAACGPILYGYTYFEEELQHTCRGWYGEEPQDWCLQYRDRYEEETGNEFKWRSGELLQWLAEKVRFFYNDLYQVIKGKYPELKVYPWTYVPGDRSGWGWIDPAELQCDGWIYQWYDSGDRFELRDCVHPHAALKQVWTPENYIEWALEKLRRAGVPNEELYVQVWGYQEQDNSLAQTAHLRRAGILNIFNFFYWAAIPPEPPPDANTWDLAWAFYAANRPETPLVRQPARDTEIPVDLGLAQSFVAPWDTLGTVEIELLSAPEGPHQITLEADRNGRPSGDPLRTFPVGPQTEPGPLRIDGLEIVLEVGQTYWLTIRPADAGERSGLKLAGSDRDPYRVGEMLRWEIHGDGYFNGWRITDPHHLSGIGSWAASFRERLRFETLLRGGPEP